MEQTTEAINDRPVSRVCPQHGSVRKAGAWCTTDRVLMMVSEHRAEQYVRWGDNRDLANGTGSDVCWIPCADMSAADTEAMFRKEWDYDVDQTPSERTWLRLLREEVAEAFAADLRDDLITELIQVAAVAVSWTEKLIEAKEAGQ